MVREAREEIAILPTDFRHIAEIADPNAPTDDPATYHLYAVTAWQGGEPRIVDDEHSELRWLAPEAAARLPDLALDEYRPILSGLPHKLPFT